MVLLIAFLSLASLIFGNDEYRHTHVKTLLNICLNYYGEKVQGGSLEAKQALYRKLKSCIAEGCERLIDFYPCYFINFQKAEWLTPYQCESIQCDCKGNIKILSISYHIKEYFPYLILYQMHADGPICQIWDSQAKVVVKTIALENKNVRVQLGCKSLFWPKSDTSLYKYDIESEQQSMVHLPTHNKFYPSIHDSAIFYLLNHHGAKKSVSKLELGNSMSTMHHTFDISFMAESLEIISLIEIANKKYSYLKAGKNLYLYNYKKGYVHQEKFAEDVAQVCCSNDNQLFSFATKKNNQNDVQSNLHVFFADDIASPLYVMNVSPFLSYMFSPSNRPIFFFWKSGQQCGYWDGNHMVPEAEIKSLEDIHSIKPFVLTNAKNDLLEMNEYDFSANENQNN